MYLERYAHAFNQPKKRVIRQIQKNFDKFLVFGYFRPNSGGKPNGG